MAYGDEVADVTLVTRRSNQSTRAATEENVSGVSKGELCVCVFSFRNKNRMHAMLRQPFGHGRTSSRKRFREVFPQPRNGEALKKKDGKEHHLDSDIRGVVQL